MKTYEKPMLKALNVNTSDIITLSMDVTELIEGDHTESALEVWYDRLK